MKPAEQPNSPILISTSSGRIKRRSWTWSITRVAGLILAALTGSTTAVAQTSGVSTTTCTQNGTTMSCTSTAQYALPIGVTLQAGTGQTVFTLNGTASTTPQCSGGMTANPSSVTAGSTSTISLSLVNCPTSGVSYSWASPAVPSTNPVSSSASHQLTLQTANTSQSYAATVCSIADATSCSTYTTNVSATGVVANSLQGCTISGAPSTAVAAGTSIGLTVQCTQGTISTRQWRLNSAAISGATAASYVVPSSATTAGASLFYSVALVGSDGSTSTPTAPAITVASQQSASCTTSGTPRMTLNYATSFANLNNLAIGGNRATYIITFNVAASDSSVGKAYLPTYGGTNSPVTGFSYRTVTVSPCPNDFSSANAQLVATENYDFNISFTTELARSGNGVAYVEPGKTYYINIRNDACASGGECTLDGQYRNWNR